MIKKYTFFTFFKYIFFCIYIIQAFGVRITCADCNAEMAKLAGVLADPTFAAGVSYW